MDTPVVNTFLTLRNENYLARVSLSDVAEDRKAARPIVVPKFGALLCAWRGSLSPNAVVVKMHRASVAMAGFTRPQLDRYEEGRTPRPDPVALFYLAQIYGSSIHAALEALVKEREEIETNKASPQPEQRSVKGRRAGSA